MTMSYEEAVELRTKQLHGQKLSDETSAEVLRIIQTSYRPFVGPNRWRQKRPKVTVDMSNPAPLDVESEGA